MARLLNLLTEELNYTNNEAKLIFSIMQFLT